MIDNQYFYLLQTILPKKYLSLNSIQSLSCICHSLKVYTKLLQSIMSSAKANRDYYISTVMPQLRMCNRPHENNENSNIIFERFDYVIHYYYLKDGLAWARCRRCINASGSLLDSGQRAVGIRFCGYNGELYRKNAEYDHCHYFNNEIQNCVKCTLVTHLQYRLHI